MTPKDKKKMLELIKKFHVASEGYTLRVTVEALITFLAATTTLRAEVDPADDEIVNLLVDVYKFRVKSAQEALLLIGRDAIFN